MPSPGSWSLGSLSQTSAEAASDDAVKQAPTSAFPSASVTLIRMLPVATGVSVAAASAVAVSVDVASSVGASVAVSVSVGASVVASVGVSVGTAVGVSVGTSVGVSVGGMIPIGSAADPWPPAGTAADWPTSG